MDTYKGPGGGEGEKEKGEEERKGDERRKDKGV